MVDLPGGLRASIEPTAALVAIDVDMAGATAGRDAKRPKQEAANRAALPALARQIRLRNLSGAILVDLAGLPQRRRAALADAVARRPRPGPGSAPACSASPPAAWRRSTAPRPPAAARVAGRPARRRAGRAASLAANADPADPPRLRAAPDVVAPCEPTRWRCRPLRTGSAAPLCCAPTRRCPRAPGHRGAPAWLRPAPSAAAAAEPARVRPFCSPRCADVDLGRWFTGQYRVPAPPGAAEERAKDT